MPYELSSLDSDTALKQVIDNSDANPLDILNDWRAGKLDNDAMFILMQRALLKMQTTPRFADPESFAQMRNRAVNKRSAEEVKLPPAQMMANKVIQAFKEYRAPKPFVVSNAYYTELVAAADRMIKDGLLPTKWVGINIVAGRDRMYKDYDGGDKFLELLDQLVDGNDGAL